MMGSVLRYISDTQCRVFIHCSLLGYRFSLRIEQIGKRIIALRNKEQTYSQ